MSTKTRRRLTTILCADVEGYSRLMEADESGTLATLQRHRGAMKTLIERHEGRIVNTWGDAVLAEFASVVEAVQCAIEMQQELSTHNSSVPAIKQMRFRIGINLGDVMIQGEDVYGDGVNVAARLQEMAEPGGIMISAPVYDQVHNKLAVRFDPLGPQHIKNIAHPVMSYRVVQGNEPALPPGRQAKRTSSPANSSLSRVWDKYLALPRPIAVLIAIIGFLFLINVFSGLESIWFHWPVAPMLLIIVLWAVLRRKPQ
jgi:adenylate cyclase